MNEPLIIPSDQPIPDRKMQPLPRIVDAEPDPRCSVEERIVLDARAERILTTAQGHVLLFGWVADEGCSLPNFQLRVGQAVLPWSAISLLRHARPDVDAVFGPGPHDFGYVLLGQLKSDGLQGAPVLCISADEGWCDLDIRPTRVSERRLLEEILAFLGSFQAHGGREVSLQRFMSGGGGAIIAQLNLQTQQRAARVQQVERFGPGRPGPSFLTVLFGSIESAMFQPLLFAKAGIAFGEWIFACNSPAQADDLMRAARTSANLYDLPIRVVLLSGNAGFGAANNAVMQCTSSRQIVLINPDVYPIEAYATLFNNGIHPERFGRSLRGGLLFYDDEMLMHGGMYVDEDVFVASGAFSREEDDAAVCRLMRVEHYDKGVPFIAEKWHKRRPVTAVTGALMAFDRNAFETIGGFSSDFVYGHYEDVDLCFRWAERLGPVEVDPDIRLVHLEGQGSKTRLPHFHGASIVNRYIFDARNRRFAATDRLSSPSSPRA